MRGTRRGDPAAAGGARAEPEPLSRRVLRYYTEATQDYAAWSPGFHMHFGYYRRGLYPWDREAMLDEMTRQVLARVASPANPRARFLDMGCGVGASVLLAARELPGARLDGVTLVPWQLEQAQRRARREGAGARVRFIRADYTATPFAPGSYDGVLAIESCCHATGLEKADFLREAARVLRPGGRLVVADGFMKGDRPAGWPLGWAIGRLCTHWALESFPEIDRFTAALGAVGFSGIVREEISWRIAPSVLHVPWVTLRFLAREARTSRLRLGSARWGHLLACVLAPFVGLARHRFGYFLVSAERA